MQKVTPHIWFDKEAKEAAEFYVSAFGGDSKLRSITTLHDTPSGDVDTVIFNLLGQDFMAISAGPLFEPNPAISFFVNFDPASDEKARDNLDALWGKLSEGGQALMPLQKYPFSEYYGWIQDKYGVSWQLILTDPKGEPRPPLIPSLMFVTDTGKVAEEAMLFYLSVFKNTRSGQLARSPKATDTAHEGAVMFADFQLEDQWFAAMDAKASQHHFAFNEAISLMVYCQDQAEIDYYWEKLSAVPESEQCGWLKDKYGVSWQIVPVAMDEMMAKGTPEQIARVTKAFLKMKKFDLAELQKAYEDQ